MNCLAPVTEGEHSVNTYRHSTATSTFGQAFDSNKQKTLANEGFHFRVKFCLSVFFSLAAPASADVGSRLLSPAADQRTFSDRDRCAAGKACSVNGSALLVIFTFNWQLGLSYI